MHSCCSSGDIDIESFQHSAQATPLPARVIALAAAAREQNHRSENLSLSIERHHSKGGREAEPSSLVPSYSNTTKVMLPASLVFLLNNRNAHPSFTQTMNAQNIMAIDYYDDDDDDVSDDDNGARRVEVFRDNSTRLGPQS